MLDFSLSKRESMMKRLHNSTLPSRCSRSFFMLGEYL